MSERIQIMRWRPRDPLATYAASDEPSREPAGTVLDFTISFVHGDLTLSGPADATKEERDMARRECFRRYPGYVLR